MVGSIDARQGFLATMVTSAQGLLLALLMSLCWSGSGRAGEAVGPCQSFQVCRFVNPEDLADLAGTPWILVSQQRTDGGDSLAAYETRTGAILPLKATTAPAAGPMDGDPACPRLPRQSNGGMDTAPAPGGWRLAVISHGEPSRIEFFRVSLQGGAPVLAWSGCVVVPSQYALNDVALMPDGVVASHMFDPKTDRKVLEAKFLKGEPTGFVVRWTLAGGWREVPNTAATFTNGVVAAPDGAWIAFAETYGHAVNRVAADGSGRRRIVLAMQPDNLTLADGGRVIVTGGTGEPMVSTRNCPQLRDVGCGFPAAAFLLDFSDNSARRLMTSGGRSMPGPSVALQKGSTLYLGTSFGNRITRVRPPAALP